MSQPDLPAQGNRPTISACMIVKNEESRLPTALGSIKPWVDEIIVVDTGSSDRTMDLAREFGAKVFEHPWEADFGKHRNQSLAYASGDWVLIIDADEELDQSTAPLLRELVLAPPPINAFMFELWNSVTTGGETFMLHARLFRNRVGFHYLGRVHNRPVIPGQIAKTKVRLIHYGYNEDPATMEAKHQRRLDMIRRWIEAEPENALAHSYLAHTYLGKAESVAQAVEEARTAIGLLPSMDQGHRHLPHAYYPLLAGLDRLGEEEELLERARQCLEAAPYYPDPLFFTSAVHYRGQNWQALRQDCELFIQLQDQCKTNPDKLIFFENLTNTMMGIVLFRWVIASAQLGMEQEALEVFERLLKERDAEEAAKQAGLNLINSGSPGLAIRLARRAGRENPSWNWPAALEALAVRQAGQDLASQTRQEGLDLLEKDRPAEAAQVLLRALDKGPQDPQALISLGKALLKAGDQDQAQVWLMRGLNLHPGFPHAWKLLAGISLSRGDTLGAAALFERYLGLNPGDDQAAQALAQCRQAPSCPMVSLAEAPPRLLVFLVGSLSPEMVRQCPPHFLMGRAWGEIMGQAQTADQPSWATLYTGASPSEHGLERDLPLGRSAAFTSLSRLTLWEALPPELRLGLLAAPLGAPPLPLPGWAVAGRGAGLLTPEAASPPELTARLLAHGFRTDFALNELEDNSLADNLRADVRQQAWLFQSERTKLAAALTLPAVDVLAVGLTALDYMHRAFELAHAHTFFAYQQLYAWIDILLATLRPAGFAIFSQRQYAAQGREPQAGGFYCLSWLKGENGRSPVEAIAPQIVAHLGGDPGLLGQPRRP